MLEVPDVTHVLVSPSSLVTELCDEYSFCSDWDFVEPQSFSFSKKRVHSCTVAQKEMWSEEPQVEATPMSRKRMMPPTPLQKSCASFEEEQGHFEVEDQMWSARDRAITQIMDVPVTQFQEGTVEVIQSIPQERVSQSALLNKSLVFQAVPDAWITRWEMVDEVQAELISRQCGSL